MDESSLIIVRMVFDYAWPVLEIAILAFFFYLCLHYIRGTRGSHILAGMAILLVCLYLVTAYINFEVINFMLSRIWTLIPFAFIVIFQPEFRRAFAQLGTTPFSSHRQRKQETLGEIVQAITTMSKRSIGALIVFERDIGLRAIANTGVAINATVSHNLLESIFYPNSPLHDGAVFIKENRIIAAHAILPLAQDDALVRSLGTRHRAAIGVTEESDAVALVVSEETGIISIAFRGHIRRDIKPDKLLRYLKAMLLPEARRGAGETFNEILGSIQEGNNENIFLEQGVKDV